MNEKRSFCLISLGCPKNLVDSVGLMTLLQRAGYVDVSIPEEADWIIVNTCGFIASAREESLEVLRELTHARRPGQRIIAAGCYSQRCPEELAEAAPGLDALIGTRSWMDIVDFVERLRTSSSLSRQEKGEGEKKWPVCHLPETSIVGEAPGVPRVAVQGASAYLKLSDGCRRSCAFCAIPLIKGRAVSRSPDAILADARLLVEQGVREIILIAQDTTSYGRDIGMRDGLAKLLEQLVAATPNQVWIRLMYAYPGSQGLTERLIETMARHSQILPYLDLPLQHAHPDVLRRMRRPPDVERVHCTLERLRTAMPDIAIRTTFLVGFPGETEMEFQSLLDFVAEMRFDRMGVFTYSHEKGTPAAALEDDVPLKVKEERRARLMEAQQPISLAKNEALVGRTLDVLIEGRGDGLSVGRSYRDAPEIDGLVMVQDDEESCSAEEQSPVGEILPVRITAALEYDLVGSPATT